MEQIIQTVLETGLEKPVRILHATDVHLVEYAAEDPVEQQEHMIARREVFRKEANFPPHTQNEYFEEAFRMAEEQDALMVVTGDVMDINCKGNWKEFHRIADGHDFMFTPGSHEFAKFCRTPKEDFPAYYAQARPQVEAAFPNIKFRFDSRVVGGLNVVTIDNSEDYFREQEFEALKKEAEKGLPMVLFMHEPLHDHGLLRIATPNPVLRRTAEEYRINDEMISFIGRCPLILATFAGHWHGQTEAVAPFGAKVYVTPGLFKGIVRMIEVR